MFSTSRPSILIILLLCTHSFLSRAQSEKGKKLEELDQKHLNWFNSNAEESKIQGVSTDLAYRTFLQDNPSKKKIVVAVIDGGVDVLHEDLKGKIWINEDEIPGNGIDDDNNGYVDDIHGWNFIGNAEGENIKYENYEFVRIYRDLRNKYEHVTSTDAFNEEEKAEYALFKKSKEAYDERYERFMKLRINNNKIYAELLRCKEVFKKHYNIENYEKRHISRIVPQTREVSRAKSYMMFLYDQGFTEEVFADQVRSVNEKLDYNLNVDLNARAIINDNINDINDNSYGNNDVKWVRSDHGTFVAGIIAANRKNDIGIDGIADNVAIMALRTVPVGDEYDKDVALSIRYAVDNGAQIINMSFGKNFSPQKGLVHDAIRYASEKGVLLVHAAGNDGVNTDTEVRYPNDNISKGQFAETWIEVGATSRKLNKKFCGIFTNYGKDNVDIFAPGVDILSLFPDDTYKVASGTSFAAPVLTGVAAVVWSCFPELTAVQLKKILLSSGTSFKKKKVYIPGKGFAKKKKIKFSELSKSGRVVDLLGALHAANEFVSHKAISQ